MIRIIGMALNETYKMLKSTENKIERYAETLKPITSLLIPQRDQSIIATIYQEHIEGTKPKCLCCPLTFANEYIRDFHMVHTHNTHLHYMCYECEKNPFLDETEIYFTSVYLLHIHKIERHDEEGYKLETYDLM